MARREESTLELVVDAPWWVGVGLAGGVFIGYRFILPGISSPNPMSVVVIDVFEMIGPWAVGLLLFAAALSAIRSLAEGQREKKQNRARIKQGISNCPKCGKPLVLKTAHKGANAGGKFWACPGFPGCRYTQDYSG